MNQLYNITSIWGGIIYIIISFFVILSIASRNKYLEILSTFSIFVFCIFFLGLRDINSGTDTFNYITTLKYSINNSRPEGWDFVFFFLSKLLYYTNNPSLFISGMVTLQLSLILIIAHLLKTKNKALILYIYISLMPGFDMLTNGLRQGISAPLALLLFSLIFIKKKIPKFSILTIIFLHKSTLTYFASSFLQFFVKRKNEQYFFKYMFIISICIIISWHFFDFTNQLNLAASKLQIQILDSSFLLGDKLSAYLTDNTEIIQGIYKYYFSIIALLLLLPKLLIKNTTSSIQNNLDFTPIWISIYIFTLIYALVWESSYSYRFMYTMFLPGIIASVHATESKHKITFYIALGTFVLGIFTYGSNTFINFKYLF